MDILTSSSAMTSYKVRRRGLACWQPSRLAVAGCCCLQMTSKMAVDLIIVA